MIIYAQDMKLMQEGFSMATFGKHKSVKDLTKVMIYRDCPVEQMVSSIIGATGLVRQSIWLLVIDAHGGPGRIRIGQGLDVTTVGCLYPLREYMNPRGEGVEIHSCSVGASSVSKHGKGRFSPFGKGYTFLLAMANTLKVPVRGGVDYQYEDDRGKIEGHNIMVFPVSD